MGAAAPMLAMTGLQTGMGFYNAYEQSKAQKLQGRYQEQISEANARMEELKAKEAIRTGQKESNAIRSKGRQIQGSQRAAYAGQGVDVSTGTPANIQNETALYSGMDELTAKNNAWREAWGYKSNASNLRYQGRIARLIGDKESRLTLLTGGINAANDITKGAYRYQGYKNSSQGRIPTENKFKPRNQTESKFDRYYNGVR